MGFSASIFRFHELRFFRLCCSFSLVPGKVVEDTGLPSQNVGVGWATFVFVSGWVGSTAIHSCAGLFLGSRHPHQQARRREHSLWLLSRVWHFGLGLRSCAENWSGIFQLQQGPPCWSRQRALQSALWCNTCHRSPRDWAVTGRFWFSCSLVLPSIIAEI